MNEIYKYNSYRELNTKLLTAVGSALAITKKIPA